MAICSCCGRDAAECAGDPCPAAACYVQSHFHVPYVLTFTNQDEKPSTFRVVGVTTNTIKVGATPVRPLTVQSPLNAPKR